MGIGQAKSWVLVVALGMLASSAAPAKSLNEKNPPSDSTKEESAASEAAKKQVLIDATRVSTSEAAKSAAKEAARRAAPRVSDDPGDSDVLEFRPVRQTTDAPAATRAAPSKDSKKSSAKRIHGEAYGLAGSANRGTGGAGGADLKGGKTAVYVEADHSRTTSPPPR